MQNSFEASLHVFVLTFEFVCGYLLNGLDKTRVLPDFKRYEIHLYVQDMQLQSRGNGLIELHEEVASLPLINRARVQYLFNLLERERYVADKENQLNAHCQERLQ